MCYFIQMLLLFLKQLSFILSKTELLNEIKISRPITCMHVLHSFQWNAMYQQKSLFNGYIPGEGGGVLKKVLYGEAPPRGPTPYPFIYHFFQKRHPFHIPS